LERRYLYISGPIRQVRDRVFQAILAKTHPTSDAERDVKS
jgi:hypothetical protein